MKLHVDPIPGVVLGLAGIGVGFVGAGLFFQRKLREELDREIQDVKDHYQHRLDEELARLSERVVAMAESGGDTGTAKAEAKAQAGWLPDFDPTAPDGVLAEEADTSRGPKTNYAAASRLPAPVIIRDGERALEQTDEENLVDRPGSARDTTKPHVISVEEFGELDNYQCLSITYYTEDKVLVDDKEVPMPDFARMVGANFMDHFGEFSGDVHIVHIRCPRLEIDFEIAQDFRSYSEVVLGYNTAEPKKKARPDTS